MRPTLPTCAGAHDRAWTWRAPGDHAGLTAGLRHDHRCVPLKPCFSYSRWRFWLLIFLRRIIKIITKPCSFGRRVPQRHNAPWTAEATAPASARSGDASAAHITEVNDHEQLRNVAETMRLRNPQQRGLGECGRGGRRELLAATAATQAVAAATAGVVTVAAATTAGRLGWCNQHRPGWADGICGLHCCDPINLLLAFSPDPGQRAADGSHPSATSSAAPHSRPRPAASSPPPPPPLRARAGRHGAGGLRCRSVQVGLRLVRAVLLQPLQQHRVPPATPAPRATTPPAVQDPLGRFESGRAGRVGQRQPLAQLHELVSERTTRHSASLASGAPSPRNTPRPPRPAVALPDRSAAASPTRSGS